MLTGCFLNNFHNLTILHHHHEAVLTVSLEAAGFSGFMAPAVSVSTVSLGPLTAAAPSLSPGVPSHYGSRDPRVTVKGVGVRFINLLRDIPPWIT